MTEIVNAAQELINREIVKVKSADYIYYNYGARHVFNETERYKVKYGNVGDIYKENDTGRYYMIIDLNNLDNPSGWAQLKTDDIPDNVKEYIAFLNYMKYNMVKFYRLYSYTKEK